MDDHTRLEAQIRYTFMVRSFLETALTHPSWVHEHDPATKNDDGQYAFLGDAVISLALADRQIVGGKGRLTQERAEKAKNEHLAELARQLTLVLRLGEGEKKNEAGAFRRRADAVEAILGAVYLDGGPDHAIKVARRLLSEGPAKLRPADIAAPAA